MRVTAFLIISVFSLGLWHSPAAEAANFQQDSQSKSSLPYGVEDVVKLCRAKISDDVIIKYVQNSGVIYNMSPELIVRLKSEGVSDHVVNTMLEQRKNVASAPTLTWQQPATEPAKAPAQPQPAPSPAPVYTQPPQPDPQPAPVSTVHIIRDYPAVYAAPYYPVYPSFGYGWHGPRFSLGVGFGFGLSHHHHHRLSHFRCR